MDKYTIDLDQLLDDFEYSELTDNSGRERPPVQNRPLSGRNHSKDLTTKHSINNVFNSLNEYLNTSVSSNDKVAFEEGHSSNVKIDNNIIDNENNDCLDNVPNNKVPKLNSEKTNESAIRKENNHEVLNECVGQLNYVQEMTEKLLDISENNALIDSGISESNAENIIDFVIENHNPCINLESTVHKEDTHTVNETLNEDKNDIKNTEEVLSSNICSDSSNVNNKNNNVIEKDNTNSEENSIVDSDKGTIENIKSNGQNEEYLSLIDNMEHESTEEDNSIESKFTEPQNTHNDESLITTQKVEGSVEENASDKVNTVKIIENDDNKVGTSIDVNNVIKSEDTIAVDQNKICDDERKCNSPKVVGFSQYMDVDDNELAKMLEDLEQDEDLEHFLPAVSDISNNRSDDIEDLKTIEAENEDCENINNLNEEIERSQKHTVDDADLKAPASLTKPDELVLDKNEAIKKEEVVGDKYEVPEDKLNTDEPKVEPACVDNLEASQETNPSSLESSQNSSDQSTRSNKPQRPQDLPLNNLKTQEEKARKINLIGSPGSTPYNNVYLNKTGSKRHKNEEDSEGGYSTSPSPTFSDVSTDSTSTASTVSIEDIERSKNMTKNTNVEKENNLEKENRTQNLQENRIQGVGDVEQNDNSNLNMTIPEPESSTNDIPNPEIGQGDSPRRTDEQWAGPYSDKSWLGKEAPLWIPDADASACLHCDMKFTMIKRRHHCRACGLVLCSKCCNLKFRLEYLDAEARVCQKCYSILSANQPGESSQSNNSGETSSSPSFKPNPNNPSEYCSTVSPLQQAETAGSSNPPSVMVPVGVLKRQGSNKSKHNKSVMFCDGIAPGSDLTNLDKDFNYQESATLQKPELTVPKVEESVKEKRVSPTRVINNYPKVDPETKCFIPSAEGGLPPLVNMDRFLVSNAKPESVYSECTNSQNLVDKLKNETLRFSLTTQLFVDLKIINMSCCINKTVWCFSTEGLINVGNDEIVYLLEYIDDEKCVPKDIFFHIHNIYLDAIQGNSVKELGLSLHNTSNFLGSKNHAGFVYIKPTFQCLENVITPKESSFLVGILIHRWETPWAKLFPLRLILRLGAEYRYYPSPIISARHRDSVFVEIGHTIINLLADFRNYSYTLPQIRGLAIHMEDKNTTITIPKNGYDQVIKAITAAPDHILAFAGNFSPEADSHLVCIQDTQGNDNNYTTHAINIHNKPRKITGASFIIFNGSLKPNSGYTAKSNIIEDGLMIQILPETLVQIRDNLRSMKDHAVNCGSVTSTNAEETVRIIWGENDSSFNAGITSPVDLLDMKGIPSIRVHNGKDFVSNTETRIIRWTEVFIIQNTEEDSKNQDPVDISKVSENIARASCKGLVNYLELLLSNSCAKIGIRVTLQADNVSYLAGSNGKTLPPIYMKSLDDELIPVLHKLTSNSLGDHVIVLELIFRILAA